jgi:hypothetical protein
VSPDASDPLRRGAEGLIVLDAGRRSQPSSAGIGYRDRVAVSHIEPTVVAELQ